MLKKEGSEKKTIIGGKDFFIIILAVVAVLLFIIFLLFVYKEQNKQNEQLQRLSQQEETEILYAAEEEPDICINEVCKEGWIELYNRNNLVVDISGYRIICGDAEVVVPDNTQIEKEGFVVFELAIESDFSVEVYGADDVLCDAVYVPLLEGKESFARKEDGGESFRYLHSSKEKTNDLAETILKDGIYFDVQSGFYNQDLQVEIVGSEGCQIYYTLDGSEPDLESEVYSGSILISNRTMEENKYSALSGLSIRTEHIAREKVEKCTLIRAAAIDSNGEKGQDITACYFVANGNKSMYQNLPVISISAQPESLFGYEYGLYSSGKIYEDALASETQGSTSANYYADYTAEAHVQYFGVDKYLEMEGDYLLQTFDDGFLDYIQKSLMLTAKGEKIILNAGGNDDALKIRDMYMQNVMQDTEAKTIDIQPCIVFLDGEYWGVYLVQRAVDENALEEQYGIVAENIACAVGGKSTDPNKQSLYDELYGYVVNSDLANETAYRKLEEMMDIQSYLDCYCAHIYIADSDWMIGNDIAWRTVTAEGKTPSDDGKWRFIFSGADFGMGSDQLSSFSINTYLRPAVANDAFLFSLMRNPEFKQRYIETMEKYAEEIFTEEKVEENLESLSEIYRKGIQASRARFNGTLSDAAYSNGVDNIKEFFQNRAEYILKYTHEFTDAERNLQLEPEQVLETEKTAEEEGTLEVQPDVNQKNE